MLIHGRAVYDRVQMLVWRPGFVLELSTLRLTLQITEIGQTGLTICQTYRDSLQIGSYTGISLKLVEMIRANLITSQQASLEAGTKQQRATGLTTQEEAISKMKINEKKSQSSQTTEDGQVTTDL